MEKSDPCNELFAALAKAQGEMKSVPKSAVNPHFKSKYATLDATQEMAREPLSKNGLAFIQSLETVGPDYIVESILTHSSGQWMSSQIKLMLFKNDMQGLGSATTYAKRYAAQAILGVSGDEDDDGNSASIPPKNTQIEKKAEAAKTNAGSPPTGGKSQNFAPVSRQVIQTINELCIDRGIQESELLYLIEKGYGTTREKCPTWIAKEILDLLKHEDTNAATIMAQASRVISRREAANLLDGQR